MESHSTALPLSYGHTQAHANLVSVAGFEPATPCSRSTCASHCATPRKGLTGSPSWVRTTDLLVNSQALCQLRYRGPNDGWYLVHESNVRPPASQTGALAPSELTRFYLVPREGFDPPTHAPSTRRSTG
jgi:hypothetical protein